MTLTTLECSTPGTAYTLFERGPGLSVHLAGPGETGGTGPCLCGYDRHKHGGFSVGGGLRGPGVLHQVCPECLALVDGKAIAGTHALLFDREEWLDKQGDVWQLGDDGLMHSPETTPLPRGHVETKWGPLTLVRTEAVSSEEARSPEGAAHG